jgi:hypothetical protein
MKSTSTKHVGSRRSTVLIIPYLLVFPDIACSV